MPTPTPSQRKETQQHVIFYFQFLLISYLTLTPTAARLPLVLVLLGQVLRRSSSTAALSSVQASGVFYARTAGQTRSGHAPPVGRGGEGREVPNRKKRPEGADSFAPKAISCSGGTWDRRGGSCASMAGRGRVVAVAAVGSSAPPSLVALHPVPRAGGLLGQRRRARKLGPRRLRLRRSVLFRRRSLQASCRHLVVHRRPRRLLLRPGRATLARLSPPGLRTVVLGTDFGPLSSSRVSHAALNSP